MKRRSFQHWLSDYKLPETLTESECQELYPRVRRGDQEAMKRLIEGQIRVAFATVAEFRRKADSDDFVSAALQQLVDSVQSIREGAIDHHEVPNMAGFIRVCLRGRLIRLCNELKRKEFKIRLNTTTMFHSELEIEETIKKIADTSQSRAVIGMRLQGLNDVQIGEELGLSKQRVHQIRKYVGTRYLELLT